MATRMEELKEQEKNIRILQDNAMKMRSANQFGRLNRMLEEVWREIDREKEAFDRMAKRYDSVWGDEKEEQMKIDREIRMRN